MTITYTLSDIFNESSIPTLTFVEPQEMKDLVGSLRTSGKHITLSGPSGCGKTTLARKALDRAGIDDGSSHWMSGRDHSDALNWPDMFAKEFACASRDEEVLAYLPAAGIVVIDDFHRLTETVQKQIGSSLKRWHELGIRLLIIGIASSNKSLLEIDTELGIRNDPYEMKRQSNGFIKEVIGRGEKALNIKFTATTAREFVEAARGIPSAIQVICRVACIRSDINETCEDLTAIETSVQEIKDGVLRIYKGKYHNKVVGLCKGKQQARSVHNTYFDIIRQLCLIGESEVQIQQLQDRIVRVIDNKDEKNRKNTSFHNCLKYLPDVINERGLGDTIYYDANSGSISVEDPSFLLYLHLVDIEEIGKAIKVRRTKYPWDVAVSFAGEDRKIVAEFRQHLNDSGYAVFYDFDIQHQLWGENLRRKLSDVYANEAQYMVVFLSKSYPEKDWTSFELEVGKDARGKRTETYLLPIILDDVHVVGLNRDVGHMDARHHSIIEIADVMIQKLEAS